MLVNIPHIIHSYCFPKISNELTKMSYCFLQSKDSKHMMSSSDVGGERGGLRVCMRLGLSRRHLQADVKTDFNTLSMKNKRSALFVDGE